MCVWVFLYDFISPHCIYPLYQLCLVFFKVSITPNKNTQSVIIIHLHDICIFNLNPYFMQLCSSTDSWKASKTSTWPIKPTRIGRPSWEPNIQNLLKGARITFRIERTVLPPRGPTMVAYFHIQHTNGGNLSLAFLKCLQFTITLLLITNRYWFSYSQNDWRLYRSDFHGSQRETEPSHTSSSLDTQLFYYTVFQAS